MYQILICSVLYSIVAKEKVWTMLFFVVSPRAKEDTRQRVWMPSAIIITLGINKSLPSATTWHSANDNGNI